jgi:hypothetical protein
MEYCNYGHVNKAIRKAYRLRGSYSIHSSCISRSEWDEDLVSRILEVETRLDGLTPEDVKTKTLVYKFFTNNIRFNPF